MGMLKSAFNVVSRLHSQGGFLKRQGTPDIYSPIRMTPSNYFRYLAGPSQTVVTGSECIIPVATIFGQSQAQMTTDVTATGGTFKIKATVDGVLQQTAAIDYTADAATIQTAAQLVWANATVTKSLEDDANVVEINFIGLKDVQNPTLDISSLVGPTDVAVVINPIAWPSPLVKRGDRIIGFGGNFTAVEVIEMPDLGGETMGYRVRYD